MNYKKPPLGLTPKAVHDKMRKKAILDAMIRYLKADIPIPEEWKDEFIDLSIIEHNKNSKYIEEWSSNPFESDY